MYEHTFVLRKADIKRYLNQKLCTTFVSLKKYLNIQQQTRESNKMVLKDNASNKMEKQADSKVCPSN